VFGVAWSPLKKKMLAVSCSDSMMRIIDLSKKDGSIKKFEGHSDKVYCVAWHPHFDHIIASGSNDCTIRVWNTKDVYSIISFRVDRKD